MTREYFIAIANALHSLEEHEVSGLGSLRWRLFRAHPIEYIMTADEPTAQMLWEAATLRLARP